MKRKKPAPKPNPWVSIEDRINKRMSRKRKNNKIQYHAKKLRELGFTVDVKLRSINTHYSSLDDIPAPARFYVRKLIRLGFNHQYSLFN